MKRTNNPMRKKVSDMRNLWRYKNTRMMLKDLIQLLDLMEKQMKFNSKNYKIRGKPKQYNF